MFHYAPKSGEIARYTVGALGTSGGQVLRTISRHTACGGFRSPAVGSARAGIATALMAAVWAVGVWTAADVAALRPVHAQGAAPAEADNSRTLVVEDFENGVGAWTRNDSIKTADPNASVVLVDLISTRPSQGGVRGSQGAGLFAFKEAQTASWASVSRRVEGAKWADIGAQRLTFWLNAGGENDGTQLVLRARTATGADEAWTIPVRLNVRQWRRVVVPLVEIKNERGPLLPRLRDVYLLQFVQRQKWSSRFFTVDQIQIEGSGQALAQSTPAAPPVAKPTPVPPVATDPNALALNVDFLRTQGRIRTTANFSIGTSVPSVTGEVRQPLTQSAPFRRAALTLSPRFVRLEAASLVDLVDSQRPSFDTRRLVAAVRTVQTLKAEPLVALANDAVWGLDERGYAAFCAAVARALPGVRYFELPTASAGTDAAVVAQYNRARAAIRAVNKLARIGGVTSTSGKTSTLQALLRGATGLEFLALQHYGAWGGMPAEATLFDAAKDLTRLRAVAAALDKSKFRVAPIYLTQSNINAARLDAGALPGDGRTVQMVSAAWWLSFLANGSRIADAVFHNDAANSEWGFVNESGEAYPAYYALWMWNTYVPVGSTRVPIAAPAPLIAIGANVPAAAGNVHNVIVANTSASEVPVRLAIRGFPVLRAARLRVLEDPRAGVRLSDLTKSPFQNFVLKPYAVAVFQFTEPPKP